MCFKKRIGGENVGSIQPMEPVLIKNIQEESGRIYQVKWDGIRLISHIDQGRVFLHTRKQKERTNIYPEIRNILIDKFASQTKTILDGEIISIKDGKPDFFQVMKRDRLKDSRKIAKVQSEIPVTYVIFDVLCWKGKWMLGSPLEERLQILEEITSDEYLQICPSYQELSRIFHFTKENGWEGIVSKELDGKYYLGQKHPTWQKYKHWKQIIGEVIGLSIKQNQVYSLLIGIKEEDGWRLIGKVSSGLTSEDQRILTEWSLEQQSDCVISHPPHMGDEVRWVIPSLQVQVEYLEWTPDGTMRSPKIIGFVKK